MMTMSRAISAGQALDYYQQEFTNSKDNYYSEAGEVKGRWSGRLAVEWELKGEVTSEQYERLVAGQDPHTGEQLVQAVKARETVNEFGEKIVTSEHRAGWDATISAPEKRFVSRARRRRRARQGRSLRERQRSTERIRGIL